MNSSRMLHGGPDIGARVHWSVAVVCWWHWVAGPTRCLMHGLAMPTGRCVVLAMSGWCKATLAENHANIHNLLAVFQIEMFIVGYKFDRHICYDGLEVYIEAMYHGQSMGWLRSWWYFRYRYVIGHPLAWRYDISHGRNYGFDVYLVLWNRGIISTDHNEDRLLMIAIFGDIVQFSFYIGRLRSWHTTHYVILQFGLIKIPD